MYEKSKYPEAIEHNRKNAQEMLERGIDATIDAYANIGHKGPIIITIVETHMQLRLRSGVDDEDIVMNKYIEVGWTVQKSWTLTNNMSVTTYTFT